MKLVVATLFGFGLIGLAVAWEAAAFFVMATSWGHDLRTFLIGFVLAVVATFPATYCAAIVGSVALRKWIAKG